MKITKIPFAIWGFQYQIVRLPLERIENRLVARMVPEAPARRFYQRSLGMLDLIACTCCDSEAEDVWSCSPSAARYSSLPPALTRPRPGSKSTLAPS